MQVYDGDKLLGETTADASGNWKLSLPALAAGAHNLVTKALDAAGKELGVSQPLTLDLPEVKASPYPAPYVITLAPGETATLPVRGFCLNYGKPFPGATLQGVDLAPATVRAAVAYALQKGYVDSDPLQVQLAVWTLIEGKKIPGQAYTVADEIIEFAKTAPAPETGAVQSLADALAKALVSAAIADYASTSPANYQYSGAGNLALTNVSKEALTLLIPYGMRFSGGAGVQDMGIFPTPQK